MGQKILHREQQMRKLYTKHYALVSIYDKGDYKTVQLIHVTRVIMHNGTRLDYMHGMTFYA